ncbi:MAG: DUF308 domain-containing protein [Eggerthellaceae bacterium]|nr:DUF308 domain-containing protein [Eggerthellaceae bacterium]
MSTVGKRDWGMVAAGVALAIVGVVFLVSPALTLVTLAVVAGVALFAIGLVDAILYFRYRKDRKLTRWALAYAAIDMVLGFALLIHPLVSAAVIPWIVGAFLVVAGVFDIIAAWQMHRGKDVLRIEAVSDLGVDMVIDESEGWGWVLFGGILAIAVAATFFLMPASFALFLSFYLVVRGIMLAIYGLTANHMVVEAQAM